jgi:hypothetical protein
VLAQVTKKIYRRAGVAQQLKLEEPLPSKDEGKNLNLQVSHVTQVQLHCVQNLLHLLAEFVVELR